MSENYREIIAELKRRSNPANAAGMARFGINPNNTLGISVRDLRSMARRIGKDHALAGRLWDSGIHEARILASLIAEPEVITRNQMNRWARDFDSWDVCDQCCMNLFDKTPYAYDKAHEWSTAKQEFVKRAAFALMASLAVHDKKAPDKAFHLFFPVIVRESNDARNYVRKAVNWALRQIGKRNPRLRQQAIKTAQIIQKMDSKSARWIASDALRELNQERDR